MGCCRARTLAFLTLITVHAAAQHTTSSGERLGSGSSTNASHAQLADWHPHGYIPGLKVRGARNQRAQTPASRLSSPQSALAKACLPSEPTHLTTDRCRATELDSVHSHITQFIHHSSSHVEFLLGFRFSVALTFAPGDTQVVEPPVDIPEPITSYLACLPPHSVPTHLSTKQYVLHRLRFSAVYTYPFLFIHLCNFFPPAFYEVCIRTHPVHRFVCYESDEKGSAQKMAVERSTTSTLPPCTCSPQ